tara:strand:+ start:392 stop:1042 length:651 start_codon:yes stop_codon:yes gene_type:complete
MSDFIEIPATKRSLTKRKPVFGIGINDANYVVQPTINGKRIWCPFYAVWRNMIMRCYSAKFQEKHPTYRGCTVAVEWLTFSNFKIWMEKQDWVGKELDKDILIPGNKEYSPKSCLLVSQTINKLLNENLANRGCLPQGVSFKNSLDKYQSYCGVSGNKKHLGYFTYISEAEYTYLKFKSSLIKELANKEEAVSNPKLQAALLIHAGLFKKKAEAVK